MSPSGSKLRNKQGYPGNLCSPSYSLGFTCHFWFPCSSGAKRGCRCSLLRQLSQPQIRLISSLVSFSSETQRPLWKFTREHTFDCMFIHIWLYTDTSLCLWFNYCVCVFYKHQEILLLTYLGVKFSLTYTRRYFCFFWLFLPNSNTKLFLLLPQERVSSLAVAMGGRDLRERKPSSSRGGGGGAEKPSGNLKNIFISPFNSPPFWLKSSDPLPRPRSIIPSIFSQKLSPPLAEPQPHPEPLARLFSVSLFFPQFLPASFINLPWRRSVQAGGSLNTMQPENFCHSLHMLLSALIPIRGGWHTVLFIPISSWIHLPRNELHK